MFGRGVGRPHVSLAATACLCAPCSLRLRFVRVFALLLRFARVALHAIVFFVWCVRFAVAVLVYVLCVVAFCVALYAVVLSLIFWKIIIYSCINSYKREV